MKYLLLLCFSFFILRSTNAQFIEIGGSLGGSTYQGDINHFSSRLSMQGAKFLNGLHLGYHFNDYYTLKLKWSNGSIGASDNNSADPWRQSRNLHFRSNISEFALIHEFELLDFLKFFRKFNLKPYVTFGVAYFHFNPQAKYKGVWYDLQPLSTEGQGLPDSKTKPYSLNQFSLPFGFGFKYYINDNFFVGIDISPRITFTDYLDDVSGSYPDLELLRNFKGPIAAELSYQGDKFPEGGGVPFDPEQSVNGRGNPKDNDWYIFNSFTVGYAFNLKEYFKRRRSFKLGRKCNFF